jgi:hypothetical protein
MVQNPKIA